jgi:hypothetical protein
MTGLASMITASAFRSFLLSEAKNRRHFYSAAAPVPGAFGHPTLSSDRTRQPPAPPFTSQGGAGFCLWLIHDKIGPMAGSGKTIPDPSPPLLTVDES